MKKPTFYNKHTYNKEIVLMVTEKALKNTNIGITGRVKAGDVIELPIEIKDINDDADCKIGCISYNAYFRTPNGVNSKFYESAEQLERSVKACCAAYGFKFVKWLDIVPTY